MEKEMEDKKPSLKVATWNINGIRSFSPAQLKLQLDGLNSDIICLQETKVTRDAIDGSSALVSGYDSFFSFSRTKSGYSGVSTFCRHGARPLKAEEGLTGILTASNEDAIACYGDLAGRDTGDKQQLDSEGRAILTQHQLEGGALLTLINVYCPRVDPERADRLKYKLDFYDALQARTQALVEAGNHVIVLGDFNCSHKPIDHCDPGDLSEFFSQPSRKWMDDLLMGQGSLHLIDTFRHVHPNVREAYTCWNTKLGARTTNFGTRIDYILCDSDLAKSVSECAIRCDIFGSDHCPVITSFCTSCIPATDTPALCTKFYPELCGIQPTLHSFLQRVDNSVIKSVAVCDKPVVSGNSKAVVVRDKPKVKRKQPGIHEYFVPRKKTCAPYDMLLGTTSQGCSYKQSYAMCQEATVERSATSQLTSALAWKSVLKGPPRPPLCKGHNEKCVLRTVKKEGPNQNKQFFCCPRSVGHKSNPEARCDTFEWVK